MAISKTQLPKGLQQDVAYIKFKPAISPKAMVFDKTKSNLTILSREELIGGFYLAGGTATALQLGHRQYSDLDFFTNHEFPVSGLIDRLNILGDFEIKQQSDSTILGKFNGESISFFSYPYTLLYPTIPYLNINLADLRDIACMKLVAISTRSQKRDFVDLYFICQKIPLRSVFDLFRQKYFDSNYNFTHILKSLSYFEKAELNPMPQMLKPLGWQTVKNFFSPTSIPIPVFD